MIGWLRGTMERVYGNGFGMGNLGREVSWGGLAEGSKSGVAAEGIVNLPNCNQF